MAVGQGAYDSKKKARYYRRKALLMARTAFIYISLMVITIFCIAPIAWILKTSFESTQYIRNPQVQWVPIQPTLEHYRARFPMGVMEEEARVLEIEALARAGQSARARELGGQFLASRPASPLAERVRRVVGGP